MGTKKKATDPEVAAAAEKKAVGKGGWGVPVVAGIVALVASAGVTYALATQPAPMEARIPAPPKPMFEIQKAPSKQSSLINRKVPSGWLGRLALQPDGLPYLHEVYDSPKLGFRIRYPYGAENLVFGPDTFAKDGIDSQATLRIDQPIIAIKVSLPTTNGEAQQDYAKQLLTQMLEDGAILVEEPRDVALPGGGFVTLAYRRKGADVDAIHRLYCAGVAKRMLIFDLMLRPEHKEVAEEYALKIMRTFEPGDLLGPVMQVKAPAKVDESKDKKQPAQP